MNKPSVYLLFSLVLFVGTQLSFPSRGLANFEYSPIVAELSTFGKSSVLLTKVTSHDEADIPVIVRVFERSLSPSGEELRTPTTELSVFPTQFILPSRGQKFLKIVWKGQPQIPYEKAFRILIEHAPVDLNARKTGAASIRMMTNYSGMIYVNTQSAVANVSVRSMTKIAKQRSLQVEVVNQGDRHLVLSEPVLEVSCKGANQKPVILKGPAVKNLQGVNMLARSSFLTSVSAPSSLTSCSEFTWQLRYSMK